MKIILIIIASFHFNAGTAATQVEFNSVRACLAARKAVVAEHHVAHDRFGRPRITAVCVSVGG